MMPLSMAGSGSSVCIQRVGGKAETKKFLESLGFTAGEKVTVITEAGGNLIVQVKEARIAISREMANKIMV